MTSCEEGGAGERISFGIPLAQGLSDEAVST